MQERLSDFVISFALFVVAAFWVWKHMNRGATTPARAYSRHSMTSLAPRS
jgi:multidrug resistance efflux pump